MDRLALLILPLVASTVLASPRPNVVLLLTDDQRGDCLSCAGHPYVKTPNIDRLAAEGVRFRNAFVTTSICCVSRASFFTGKLCRHHGVGDFSTPLSARNLDDSLPGVLQRSGYRTGCFGKWGIGGPEPRRLFDDWAAWAGQGEYFVQEDGVIRHNSDYLAMRATRFLCNVPREQPFFLSVLFKAPHDHFLPAFRDDFLFDGVTFPRPATGTPSHFDRMPDFLRKSLGKTRADKDIPTEAKFQKYVADYYRLIIGMDRAVGSILDTLDALRLRENTIVVFASDNGYFLGERGLVHKWLMYEESIRIPLIVRAPGAGHGKIVEAMALNIDVAPTIFDLAGVTSPAQLDGRSLRPLLEGRDVAWRSDFFYEHHFDADGTIPRTEGVRTDRWKYITYPGRQPAFEELYDLQNDPREEKNLAGSCSAELTAMRQRYREYTKALPPPVLPRAPRRPSRRDG